MNGVGESPTEIEMIESLLTKQEKTTKTGHLRLNPAREPIAVGETVTGRARIRAGRPTTPPVAIGAEVLTAKYDIVTVIANPNSSKRMGQVPRMKHSTLLRNPALPIEPLIVVQIKKSPIGVGMRTVRANVAGVTVITIGTGSGPVATGPSHQRKVSTHPGIIRVVSSAATVMRSSMKVERRNLQARIGTEKKNDLERKIETGNVTKIRTSPGAATKIESVGNVTVNETGRLRRRSRRHPARRKTLTHWNARHGTVNDCSKNSNDGKQSTPIETVRGADDGSRAASRNEVLLAADG